MKKNSKTTLLVVNGIIAAVYVAVTIVVTPFAQGPIQFRVSESLNHLVVFNKKLRWGVIAGVFIYNLLFSNYLDVLFGTGQTFLALTATAMLNPQKVDTKWRLFWNTVFFSVSMALIALMLKMTAGLPFWLTYGTTALSEAIIMGISAPIMYWINKNVHFERYQ